MMGEVMIVVVDVGIFFVVLDCFNLLGGKVVVGFVFDEGW